MDYYVAFTIVLHLNLPAIVEVFRHFSSTKLTETSRSARAFAQSVAVARGNRAIARWPDGNLGAVPIGGKNSGDEFPKPSVGAIDTASVDVRCNCRRYRARGLARRGAERQDLYPGNARAMDEQVRRRQARFQAGRPAG